MRMIPFDFKIGKKYDGSTTNDEHINMENAVKIRKTNAQPKFKSKLDLFFVQIITFELNIGYSKFK